MQTTLRYLFLSFIKIGSTSWGGFMALIAVIQKQLSVKDKKIEDETLAEAISLASVLPGPLAVNVVAYIGYKLRGWKGALISITAILLPSFIFMLLLSDLYLHYGNIPVLKGFFAGVMPAVAAIIISVAAGMAKKNITGIYQWIIGIAAAVLVFFSGSYFTTLIVLMAGALLGYLFCHKKNAAGESSVDNKTGYRPGNTNMLLITGLFVLLLAALNLYQSWLGGSNLEVKIFTTFSSVSVTQFGGGYVIIPSMQKLVVHSLGWLDNKQFADAVAMGQITPGPIFVVATFIGYKLAGFMGALNATIAVFFPAALLMIICSHYLAQIKNSAVVAAIFKGIRPVVVGMIFSAGISILVSSGFSMVCIIIFAVSLIGAIALKLNPVYLIPLAGMAGIFIFK